MQIAEILLTNNPDFVYINSKSLNINDKVIVSSSGSIELGIVKNIYETTDEIDVVDFVRIATQEDFKTHCDNCKYARSIIPQVKNEAESLKLDMKVAFASVNFDRSKIVINYTADNRVDFRELVKILGSKFKARIEMRQIGNRDETKVLGAIGVCGRETCCKAYLSEFDKVTIKMAKNQNIALNPNRINGMCGRLLCCFKYEDEFYEDMQKKMPKVGSFVTTPDGKGEVTGVNFLRETVTVTFKKDEDSTEIKTFNISDISKIK